MDREYRILGGIFLISTAALAFEIALTRVLSVAFWHHFAFLVISIALFGIAASGTFLCLFPIRRELEDSLSFFSLLFSISALGSYAVVNSVSFDPFRFFLDRSQVLLIFLYYLLLAVPFFFFGLCMAVSFEKRPQDAGRLYFANLTGSGVGALGVLGLFSLFGGSGVLVFSAIIGLVASFFFSSKRKVLNGAVLFILLALLFMPSPLLEINMSPYKSLPLALRYPGSRLVSSEWNSISRVDVVESGYVRYAPGLSLSYQERLPNQLGLAVDGSVVSAVTEFDGSPLRFTGYLTSSLPYILNRDGKVLLIAPGGGLEIIQALSNDASEIKAIEPNSLIVETVWGLQGFSSVYSDPRVEVVDAEVRSYLETYDDRFDIIQIGLSSAAPASSTGVYALTENYLFTVEAFKEYLGHLSDDGILSITRWLQPPPRESLRTVSIALEAMDELGIEAPYENVAVLRSFGTITVVVKKTAFTPGEIEEIRVFARSRGFDIVYVPGVSESEVNIYNRFPEDYYYLTISDLVTASDREEFYRAYLFDVSPVRDENPFFFQFFKPDRLKETYESIGKKWQIFIEGGYIVYILFVQALVLTLIFVLLPLAGRRGGLEMPQKAGSLSYFFLIGVGFMFVEIPLIQRFILFLGRPVFAVSTVLFGLLVFSGLGSLYTSRSAVSVGRLKHRLTLLVVTVLFYLFFFLPWFFSVVRTTDVWLRYATAVLALAPVGFLMGMPFPMGIRLLEKVDVTLIPWAWAANGSASVLASILAVIIAMHSGFSLVVFLASLIYALSLVSVAVAFRPLRLGGQRGRL